jgi:hypothetical protein
MLFPPKVEAESPHTGGSRVPGAPSHRRKKLREIQASYHCAIVGTCLPIGELRRLARRAGLEQCNSESDYELHHATVGLARQRNALSQLVQKELKDRFALAVKHFAHSKTENEIRRLWKEALSHGEVPGALWALMSHAHATESVLDLACQDIHMLSHQVGAASRADLRRLSTLQREAESLRARLERERTKFAAKLAEKDHALATLAQRAAMVSELGSQLRTTEARLRELESAEVPAHTQQPPVAASFRAQHFEQLARRRKEEIAQNETRCERLERELQAAQRERDAAEVRTLIGELSCSDGRDRCPTNPRDLGGRRVLCVGGRTGLVEQYRVLVERWHGSFMHHDGGVEHAAKRLHTLLAAADAVICAAGNVSHGAYYVVKRYCKQHGKPCVLLKNSGLSSFLNGLRPIAAQAEAGNAALLSASDGRIGQLSS